MEFLFLVMISFVVSMYAIFLCIRHDNEILGGFFVIIMIICVFIFALAGIKYVWNVI